MESGAERRRAGSSEITDRARNCWIAKSGVRQETVKEYVVKVHCNEGVAIHIGPEPCAVIREGVGEASVGDGIGQPLNHGKRRETGRR